MADNTQQTRGPTRLWRLASVRSVRKELSAIYREARFGKLDWQSAARAAMVLQIMAKMIEQDDIEARIAKLEEAAAVPDEQATYTVRRSRLEVVQ